jgi:replication factor C subunit 2/4
LDEADAMTGAAQSALRRTMESETQTTRFFLICNYITRIIEPLTSRCAKYRFKPLPKDIQKERLLLYTYKSQLNLINIRLLMIADAEGVDLKPDSIDELVSISGGDLRKSITLMQSMACSGQPVTVDEVREMSGQIPNAEVTTLIQVANTMDHKAVTK